MLRQAGDGGKRGLHLPAGTEDGRGRKPGLPAPLRRPDPDLGKFSPPVGRSAQAGKGGGTQAPHQVRAVPEVWLGARWMVGANPPP